MGSLANPVTPIQQEDDPALPLIPTELRAGDSWNWTMEFENYPASEYTLNLIFNSDLNRFVVPSGAIAADQDGQTFDVQATSTQTGSCAADTYDVSAVLAGIGGTSAAGQQVTLALQRVRVDVNLLTQTGPVDSRSFVKKTLDMIEAAILGNARPDVQEYEIQGRQIRKIAPADLLALRQEYRALYKSELRAAGVYSSPRKIGFTFRSRY